MKIKDISGWRATLPVACAVVTLALGIAGCVSYQPKPGEQAAKLRLTTFSPSFTYLNVQDMNACPRQELAVMQKIDNVGMPPTSIGMMGAPEPGSRKHLETLIPAGRPLFGKLSAGTVATQYSGGYSCGFGFTFNPTPDAQYEVVFREGEKSCGARLYELKALSDGEVIKVAEPSFKTFALEQSSCYRRL
ncbi:hypothetical protein DBR42_27465 [Pelomonas sp. HMWF004]|nr:hypothetical protein DBR42_27465 [Pelomonas sp. HMWF004]